MEVLRAGVRLGRFGAVDLALEAGVDLEVVERWLAQAGQAGWVVRRGDDYEVTAEGWAAGMAPGCGG